MGKFTRDIKRVEVVTSAGSTVLAHTISTENNSSIKIRTELLGRRNFNTDTLCRVSNHCFKNVVGTVSQVGASHDMISVSTGTMSTSSIIFTISGSDIQISVKGPTDVTILSVSWELVIYIEVN